MGDVVGDSLGSAEQIEDASTCARERPGVLDVSSGRVRHGGRQRGVLAVTHPAGWPRAAERW